MCIAFFRDAGNDVFNPNLGVGGDVGKNTRVKESENKIPHTTGFITTQMQ